MADIRHGDNADVMQAMLDAGERFTLAYLDPPFFTGRDFRTSDGLFAYSDKWASFDMYLETLLVRVSLAFRLLEPHGSIVVHVDPTVSHHVKVRCDGLFGRDHFVDEIVWSYRRWTSPRRGFQRMHDVLLRYAPQPGKARWNQPYTPKTPSSVATRGAGRGVNEIVDGKLKTRSTAEPVPGVAMPDVWPDLGRGVTNTSKERTGFPTQKPENLLERLVLALTNRGDRVIDPYMGSGTMLAVCYRLGRVATGIDASEVAIAVSRKRLLSLEAGGRDG